ncbi:MAG: single-stranded-DNA-specific exonuclease RecJ [Planctomycetaceae bacterium]|nr:single-stranded-DNA-specific exonuclease RecJ [Planctomycetaceae bacterium]
MRKLWRIRPHDQDRIVAFERAARVPPVIAQLLLGRGIDDPDRAREFLEPKLTALREPDELPGLPAAADAVAKAVSDRRRIVIYGDYDVDGVSATAILWRCLTLLGADVGYYVPHRLEEGYGLNNEALETLARQGAQTIVSVDCGVSAVAEAETAARLGLELIITDHHTIGPVLPQAAAIVHPALPGSAYPFQGLSGAGVAFKLAWGVCQRASQAKRVNPAMREFLMQAVALAALGTVADVVPLLDENRVIVYHGLESLRQRPLLGLQHLLRVTELDRKPRLTSEDVAFTLAPRINAAGRLGEARLAVELLTTASEERAAMLAGYIDELNSQRQTLERSIYLAAHKQALEQIEAGHDAALVLADRGWHAGVVGIIAGRIAEKFHCPTLMVSLDDLGVRPGIGSARSVPGFDLHQALHQCREHLLSCGGHAAAAGFKIEEARLPEFRADFCEYVATTLKPESRIAELWIDAEAPFSAFTLPIIDQIERLAPFGEGNRRPLLCAQGVRLSEPPKRIGGGGRHLALSLEQHGVRLRGVSFGNGDWETELAQVEGPLAFAFRPVINDFRGQRKVELQIVDWQTADGVSPAPRPPAAEVEAAGPLG